jgi:hypothetical protein
MKKRHVFSAQSVPEAESIVRAARQSGIPAKCICLEARSDLEIGRISDELKNVSMDFVPAALRGTVDGAVAGLLAGVLAMFIPFFGVSLGGAFALMILGGLVGTWASVLMGAALPDEVRRTFEGEIAAGKILVVIDGEPEEFDGAERAIVDAGGIRLPFETLSALT